MKKYKYIFDLKTGHYIKKLNEADEEGKVTTDVDTASGSNAEKTDNKTDDTTTTSNTSKGLSVESNDAYKKIVQQENDENVKFEQLQNNLQKKLVAAKLNAESKSSASGDYDKIATDATVLSIQKQILDLLKQHNEKIYNFEMLKIAQLQALSTAKSSAEAKSTRIYNKYKDRLNESNIHTAKVYVNNLISNDEEHIIKGMNDFKRCLKDSNLLYGKDPDGYFIVCVDQEDFDNMYDSLQEVGYLRDDIIDTVMPQLFNRQNMIQ